MIMAYPGKIQRNEGVKRMLDLAIAIPACLALFPVFVLTGMAVFMVFGRPVFFRQVRPGKNGRPFVIYKFRTMSCEKSPDGKLLSEADRLKSLGRFLRKMSLDELPELWNVIKGDMSLVGPRPLLMQYLGHYSAFHTRRHEVRPGITGWAQVHGRNNTPFSRRFEMDVWYVDHHSLGLDLRIILMTLAKVFKREGVRGDLEACYREVNDCGLPDIIEG
ncbi:MAG: sugar transferase [Candidatus Omnitrophota bacterium]